MNFQKERKIVENLRKDKSKLVFWKKELAFEKYGVIVSEKRWTTDNAYLAGNKLYEIGTNMLLCESWVDEQYLEEVSNGQNIVVITE